MHSASPQVLHQHGTDSPRRRRHRDVHAPTGSERSSRGVSSYADDVESSGGFPLQHNGLPDQLGRRHQDYVFRVAGPLGGPPEDLVADRELRYFAAHRGNAPSKITALA